MPKGEVFMCVCVCFLADLHNQAAAYSASSVLEGFLSMPLCARQELFPLSRCIKRQGGEQKCLQISIHSNFMYVQREI